MTKREMGRTTLAALLFVALVPAASAQWVTFTNESATRMVSSPNVGLSDTKEKDYAWGDVDKDGDVDLVSVRKQPFTSPGKETNVLFLNQNGVLVDRTADFATDSSVAGDNGFLTPTNDRDVVIVDLDLDGWLDIVTATTISDSDPKYIGHPRIYMNRGCAVGGGTAATSCTTNDWLGYFYDEPRIPAMKTYTGQTGFNPRFCSVSAGDVTGDGYPELFFGDYDSSGAGGNQEPNGADYNDKFLVNAGASNPGFFTDVTPDPARFVGNVPGVNQEFPVSAFGAANAIRDMNGDGFNDIVKQTSLNSPLYVGVAYNNSTATLGFFDTFDVVNQLSPYFVSVNDLNNDDKLDMVITDDGSDRYLLNQGGGFVPDFISFTFSFKNTGGNGNSSDDGFGSQSLIVDLDKDGWNDVLISDVDVDIGGCSRRLHIYRNLGGTPGSNVTLQEQTTGDGCQSFQGNPPSCLVTSIPSDKLEGTFHVAAIDLNGDTWDDLVLGRCSGTEIYMQVPPGPPAGSVDDFDTATQLLMGKSGSSYTLSWGASCNLDDTDYGVYEGRLEPPFDGHAKKMCSTLGATTATITAGDDSYYYLIVPNNGTFEGSYGMATSGPRPNGVTTCYMQNVASCP